MFVGMYFSFIHCSLTNFLSQSVFAVTVELISNQQRKQNYLGHFIPYFLSRH